MDWTLKPAKAGQRADAGRLRRISAHAVARFTPYQLGGSFDRSCEFRQDHCRCYSYPRFDPVSLVKSQRSIESALLID